MKAQSSIVTLFFLCAVFFFAGFKLYPTYFKIVLPEVDGIKYVMNYVAIDTHRDRFAAVFAAVPLLIFITWRIIPLESGDKKTFSALVVLICMALATFIRYRILVSRFNDMVESSSNLNYGISVAFEQLGYEWYLTGGLLAGCIVTYLAFHNKIIRRQILIRSD